MLNLMSRNCGICDCRNHIQRQPSPALSRLVLYQEKLAADSLVEQWNCMAVQVPAGQSLQSLLLALLELILEVIVLALKINLHEGTFHSHAVTFHSLAMQQACAGCSKTAAASFVCASLQA